MRAEPLNVPLVSLALQQGGAAGEVPPRGVVVTTSSQTPVAALTEALLSGQRCVALTGEPGVSRSAIVDRFSIRLVEAGAGVIRVRNTAPGPLGVSRLVALLVGSPFTGVGRGVDDELQRVVGVLTASSYRGKRLVLLIEHAESLDGPALAMLRLLPDLPREGSPPAQIALVGRSGLWTLLAEPAHAGSGQDEIPPPAPVAIEATREVGYVAPSEWSSMLSSFEPEGEGNRGGVFAGLSPPHALRRWVIALLLAGGGMIAVSFLAYHAFYRGLPFRPASQPLAVASPTASAPPPPARSLAAPNNPTVNPQQSAGPVTPKLEDTKPQPASSEKLRQDFDAFLLRQGGDIARLNEADRRELFNQYLSRRAAH